MFNNNPLASLLDLPNSHICPIPTSPPPTNPQVLPHSYQSYVSPEGYEQIQGLLPYAGKLTSDIINEIIDIQTNGLFRLDLMAFGPKVLEDDLLHWYANRFAPLYEGEIHHLYLDYVGNITIGTGFNLSDKLGEKIKVKKRMQLKFEPNKFLSSDNNVRKQYQQLVLKQLKSYFPKFFALKKPNIKKIKNEDFNERDLYLVDDNEIITALEYLSHRIQEHKYGTAKSIVSKENSIVIDDPESKNATFKRLKEMIKDIDVNHRFPNLRNFPAGAQLAILDLVYNTNYAAWKHKSKNLDLTTFNKLIKGEKISKNSYKLFTNWHELAYDASNNEQTCAKASIYHTDPKENTFKVSVIIKKKLKHNKTSIKKYSHNEVHCKNFFFWRLALELDKNKKQDPHKLNERNIATQILLILADEWEKKASIMQP